MSREVHISSLVVQTVPEQINAVGVAMVALGLEVHRSDPVQGKIVATLECSGKGEILGALEGTRSIDGVVWANLVYHHCEDEHDLDQPLPSNQEARP